MKFTLSWLKDHFETNASLEDILYALTDLGLEVEGVEIPAEKLAPFTIAKVLHAEKHPDADKLRVCRVMTDGAVRQELGERVHLNVTSFNRQVLLSGEAATASDREQAEKLAQSQENVKTVVNDLAIMAPSSLTQRTKDTVISSQIKASFIDAKDLQSNSIKVVTERGIVYLMGRVTQREAKRATDIARSVGGVTKVVRVFEEISEEELKRLSQPPMGK